LDAEKEGYSTSDVDDDEGSDNHKVPAAPRPESDAEYHSDEDGSLHDGELEEPGVACVEFGQPDNESDVSSNSDRSYEVESLTIENNCLLKNIESLPCETVFGMMKVSEAMLTQKWETSKWQQWRLEKKVAGLQSLVKEKDKRIDLLQKNRRI